MLQFDSDNLPRTPQRRFADAFYGCHRFHCDANAWYPKIGSAVRVCPLVPVLRRELSPARDARSYSVLITGRMVLSNKEDWKSLNPVIVFPLVAQDA